MKPSTFLEAALTKLDGGKAWCKSSYARDAEGKPIHTDDPRACQWCMQGAVWAVTPPKGTEWLVAMKYLDRETIYAITTTNDKAIDFSEVANIFNNAISKAKAAGE